MHFFVSNFKWVMLISGLLTCTMFLALFSQHASLKSNFAETIEGPAEEIIVRNWGELIGLMSIMLIYGALTPAVRKFTLVIADITKTIFISLVLSSGIAYSGLGAGTAVVADSVMVVLYVAYLLLSRSAR